MKRAMTIRIEEITCYGYHGVLPEEQVLGQEFRVSLELALDGAPPAEDQLSETVDYRRAVELVCKIIEGKPRRLLETVAGEIAAALLEIEVSERTALATLEANAVRLGELRAMGVRVALDDFGVAQASLQHLRELPLDGLKIDRTFVARLGGDHHTGAHQLGGDPLRFVLGLALRFLAGTAQSLGGADGTLGGLHGLLLGEQVVAGVAVGYIDDVALLAERRHIGSEYELHFVAT